MTNYKEEYISFVMDRTKNPSVYLVDISSLFFRSYYAISLNMKNEKGQPTNAVYGVLKMLDQLIRKKNPDYLLCCFDNKEGSAFRKKIYPDYKANRDEMPEDLELQVPYLKKLMDKLLIPSWEELGVEADDLIATLVEKAKQKKWTSFIVSGDKDFAQIVDKQVFLYDTMKDIIYDQEGVEQKWGLPPSQIQDFLSLTGDASDNIPGVKGVGPKGAVQLLKQYKNLEGVYKNIEEVKGKLKEKLITDKEMAFLSRKLIALKKNVPVKKDFFKQKYKDFSHFSEKEKQDFKELLEELKFNSFLKKLFGNIKVVNKVSPSHLKQATPAQTEQKTTHFTTLKVDQKSLNNLSAQNRSFFLKTKQVSIEEFKKDLEPYPKLWVGVFQHYFYLFHKKKFCLISHKELQQLTEFLDHKWPRYLGHDLKSFWRLLKPKHPIAEWDSMIAGHLVGSLSNPSLSQLFNIHLNIPKETHLKPIEQLSEELKLQEKLLRLLEKENMLELYQNIEQPFIAVLYEMEQTGFCIDLKEITEQSQSLKVDIEKLESQIYKQVGESFNLSSPKQLGAILFDKLKLPRGRKTKTGFSTDSHELIKIKERHPVLPLLLEHRELFKLKSTYTDPIIQMRDKKTGRIYTEFKQSMTATGRLSSLNPNLQNIPIRTKRGRQIRQAFVSDKGKTLICADYSQLELRVLAEITGDKNLKKAFDNDWDVHAMTASEIFNIPLKEVSPELRRKSKAVNFGIAYGQGAYGLAENLSISRAEAKEIIENYFNKFKKIKDYIETVKEELKKRNYVKTLYGRKRFFNTEDLRHPRLRAGVERAAINAPLQGTASDLVKTAMIHLNESLSSPIICQVHDELLFEIPEASLSRDTEEIKQLMEDQPVLKVPLKVNIGSGKNWFLAHS